MMCDSCGLGVRVWRSLWRGWHVCPACFYRAACLYLMPEAVVFARCTLHARAMQAAFVRE